MTETWGVQVEHLRFRGGLRRDAEAMVSLQAAEAALRGAQARPGPCDGPERQMGRGRQTGQTACWFHRVGGGRPWPLSTAIDA